MSNANVVSLVHPFKDKCPDIEEFLKADNNIGVINTVESLCSKIKWMSEKYALTYDPDKLKGDAWELFTEFFVKTNASDNRVGIYDYKPITEDDQEDNGVDGSGIGENSNPATVQAKYRTGDYVLTANNDHLSNFLTASWVDFQVPIEDDKNMLIITSGLKVDDASRERMLKNKVRVLNRDALRQMLDNRPEWWLRFYDAVKASRTTATPVSTVVLREHQKEAADIVIEVFANGISRGQVILPTGVGKTYIEAEVIKRKIEECLSEGIIPLIKVNSSRILLCFQLFEDIFMYLSAFGIHAKYINYNSGNADDKYYTIQMRKLGGIYREISSTTSVKEVKEDIKKAFKEEMPVIVLSTYHSSEKFSKCDYVPNLTVHDEAHNLVSREFTRAATLPSDEDVFFTATLKVTDSDGDRGMNNEDIFGKIMYTKSAKEMIDRGEMVPPWVHVVKGSGSKGIDIEKVDADYEALFKSIESAFFAHEKKIKELSYNPDEMGAKILVVCRGQQDLIEMNKTKAWANFRILYPDIHIFALSSEFGILHNEEFSPAPVTNVKKFKMIKAVKGLKSSERCLIFHVDMVGEGIDVPGITGVMPFRNCEMSKFIQNVGRSARLHKTDRTRFYNGEIVVGGKGWIKPCSWIIIPEFLTGSDGFAGRFKEIIEKLRNEYGFLPKQHTLIDNSNGLSIEEDIDTVNDKNKCKKHTNSGVDTFTHDFDEMSAIEKIIFDDQAYGATKAVILEIENLLKGC